MLVVFAFLRVELPKHPWWFGFFLFSILVLLWLFESNHNRSQIQVSLLLSSLSPRWSFRVYLLNVNVDYLFGNYMEISIGLPNVRLWLSTVYVFSYNSAIYPSLYTFEFIYTYLYLTIYYLLRKRKINSNKKVILVDVRWKVKNV